MLICPDLTQHGPNIGATSYKGCYNSVFNYLLSVFSADLMNMGGYNAPPVMLSGGGAGGKPERGGSKRGYSQYAFPYGPGGWGDHHVAGGFYPAGFGMHMPMMRGHMGMDPAAMDYMAEQFQGKHKNCSGTSDRGHPLNKGHPNSQ